MKRPVVETSARRRRALLGAAVAAVVVGLLVTVLLVRGAADRSSATAAGSASPVSLAPAPPTPVAAGPTSEANEAPASLPAVSLDEAAHVGNGVSAEVTKLDAIDGTGTGPGNISGPALRVTVRITNASADAVSLDGVAVDLTHGADALPASPLNDPSAAPFTGTLAAGDSAEGVYVFTVPKDDRELITVTVGYQAGAPFMVFTGSAR